MWDSSRHVPFFANIRALESTNDNDKERARLLQSALTLAAKRILMAAIVQLWSLAAAAGPNLAAGDLALRHDIQRLADAGVI